MWTKILFALGCVVFVAADTEKASGHCPDLPAVEHFDGPRFSVGNWYLVEHTDSDEYKCTYAHLFTEDDKKYFQIHGIKNGNKMEGKIEFTTVSPGVFKVTGAGEFDGESKVIATNYDDYSVSHACVYDASDDTHTDRVFIHVRGKHAEHPEETIATAKAAIEGKLSHAVNFHTVSHADCEHDHSH